MENRKAYERALEVLQKGDPEALSKLLSNLAYQPLVGGVSSPTRTWEFKVPVAIPEEALSVKAK